jgi:putative aldouronate transport system permease protein
VTSELWKEMGWNAIIYLAAISGIDPTLYESAQIDGASRLRRNFSITIPSIKARSRCC